MKQQAIYERDDHTCQYCGNGASSLDHLLPRALGGRDEWDNLVCACGTCNRLKGEGHYPHLIASLRSLILQGRTSHRSYPPLLWQVWALDLPHEALETNSNEGRWYNRTLLKLIFSEPEREEPFLRRRKLGAVRKLASVVLHVDAPEASEVLSRLCEEGQLRETAHYYVLERAL